MMNNNPAPLISIIVPIFKVEEYLDECVQSILRQTYNNLEVILVDDGSPDRCPAMCDEYAAQDSRVRVIHKKNGGLSSARNAGLNVAKGDYIGFVDSDDWIAEDMYEKLFSGFSISDTIGVVSSMFWTINPNGDRSILRYDWLVTSPRTIRGKNLPLHIAKEAVSHSVWNKLFKKSCIGDVRFWEGRNNEDWPFMFILSLRMKAEGYDFYEIPDYTNYYRLRQGSITKNEVTFSRTIVENVWDVYQLIQTSPQSTDVGKEVRHILLKKYVDAVFLNAFFEAIGTEAGKKCKKNIDRLGFFEFVKVAGYRQRLALFILKYLPFLWKSKKVRDYCLYK